MAEGEEVMAKRVVFLAGRRAIGIELKDTYYRQAQKNIGEALAARGGGKQSELFDAVGAE